MTTRRGPYGGHIENKFDDGVNDDVRKVIVGEDSDGVVSIKIEYVRDGNVVRREHGRKTGTQITETDLEVDYPDEYITSIWGTYKIGPWYKNPHGSPFQQVMELQFKTSYGRTSRKFDEYITSVEGHYGKKLPLSGPEREWRERERDYITMLRFKTNLGEIHQVLGSETPNYEYVGTSFVFEETDHKILGFHGKSTYSPGYRGQSTLEQIGVYVKPIDND